MTDRRRRRPWLAVLLAFLVSGLGHAYLRRWARAFGWYAAVTATLVFIVPDAAVDRLVSGDPPPVADIGPAVVVVAASVIDAYVLAIRNNRELEREQQAATSKRGDPEATAAGTTTAGTSPRSDQSSDVVSCPHCGRETDPSFDFCQWCAEPTSE
ncbi:DUF6677 family protein [Halorubrum sp. HHNYT27]|uniref:DUF6677 family protein n=1 Tax=Halorubrum sp. HHNYT27 TaxID=3402275 RepID=UPI003EBB482A